jgi:hypothetical protein
MYSVDNMTTFLFNSFKFADSLRILISTRLLCQIYVLCQILMICLLLLNCTLLTLEPQVGLAMEVDAPSAGPSQVAVAQRFASCERVGVPKLMIFWAVLPRARARCFTTQLALVYTEGNS